MSPTQVRPPFRTEQMASSKALLDLRVNTHAVRRRSYHSFSAREKS